MCDGDESNKNIYIVPAMNKLQSLKNTVLIYSINYV